MEEDCNSFKIIGRIRSVFKFKNGTPRQPGVCDGACGQLAIEKDVFNNPEHALEGLTDFSHVWVLFIFHKNDQESVKAKVKPPRLGSKIGLFASRSPHRPTPIGLSLAKLEKIEGATIYLSGLDIIDETPVVDIKPYIPGYDKPADTQTAEQSDPSEIRVASWITQANTSKLTVLFTERSLSQLQMFSCNPENPDYELEHLKNWSEAKNALISVLEADPRSVYRKKECNDRLYYFTLDNLHITSWFDDKIVEILKVQPIKYSQLHEQVNNK